jgi:hypothetical protein
MISDESGRKLHDLATRGGMLSVEECAQLEAWLAAQDLAEGNLLATKRTEPAVSELRAQVDKALEQAGVVTRTIQRLFAENDSLRSENDVLRNRLAARAVSQAA